MATPPVVPIHFVGSLPLAPAEKVLTHLPLSLPSGTLERLPDGEPGARNNFTAWQWGVFASQGLEPTFMPFDATSQQTWRSDWSSKEVEDVMKRVPEVLETGYDIAALESWAVFKQAKAEGGVPEGVKFQVGIPTPANFLPFGVQPAFQRAIEPRYAAGLEHAVRKIQDDIPHEQLAIQLDLAVEFAVLHGAWYSEALSAQQLVPEGSEEMMKALVDRVVRLASAVDEDVELGFHCCYGDLGGRHFVQPEDTGMVAAFFSKVLESLKRPLAWVHCPMPAERDDEAYLEPMKELLSKLDERTQVFVGLIHGGDMEGTKRRVETVKKVFGGRPFGLATECGLGRVSEAQLEGVFEVMREVCGG